MSQFENSFAELKVNLLKFGVDISSKGTMNQSQIEIYKKKLNHLEARERIEKNKELLREKLNKKSNKNKKPTNKFTTEDSMIIDTYPSQEETITKLTKNEKFRTVPVKTKLINYDEAGGKNLTNNDNLTLTTQEIPKVIKGEKSKKDKSVIVINEFKDDTFPNNNNNSLPSQEILNSVKKGRSTKDFSLKRKAIDKPEEVETGSTSTTTKNNKRMRIQSDALDLSISMESKKSVDNLIAKIPKTIEKLSTILEVPSYNENLADENAKPSKTKIDHPSKKVSHRGRKKKEEAIIISSNELENIEIIDNLIIDNNPQDKVSQTNNSSFHNNVPDMNVPQLEKTVVQRPLYIEIVDQVNGFLIPNIDIFVYYQGTNKKFVKLCQSNTGLVGKGLDLLELSTFSSGLYKVTLDVGAYYTDQNMEAMFPLIEFYVNIENPALNHSLRILLSPHSYTVNVLKTAQV